MANGNQLETPPTADVILAGKTSGVASTNIVFAVDESEVIPICNLLLTIKNMRFDLLEAKLAEILEYISTMTNSNI